MADAGMIYVLTEIWQRVLKCPLIGPEQSFFELVGDTESAVELFREIARTFGRELAPVMICQAPTIRSLAAILSSAQAPECPPVVLLKPGTESPPIFLAHGLAGDALQLLNLAS